MRQSGKAGERKMKGKPRGREREKGGREEEVKEVVGKG